MPKRRRESWWLLLNNQEYSGRQSGANRWSKLITAAIIIFILHLLALVIIASVQKIDLVRKDYYPAELKHQQQIDRINRSKQLENSVSIHFLPDERVVEIGSPPNFNWDLISGRIELYRPSDAGLDRSLPLEFNAEGKQIISTEDLANGLWRIKVNWKLGDLEYYDETVIVID